MTNPNLPENLIEVCDKLCRAKALVDLLEMACGHLDDFDRNAIGDGCGVITETLNAARETLKEIAYREMEAET